MLSAAAILPAGSSGRHCELWGVGGWARPPAGDPEEEEALVLQHGDVEAPHLVVRQRPVGQLHVDVPGRVGHHHRKLAQDAHVQVADVAADPLRGEGRGGDGDGTGDAAREPRTSLKS